MLEEINYSRGVRKRGTVRERVTFEFTFPTKPGAAAMGESEGLDQNDYFFIVVAYVTFHTATLTASTTLRAGVRAD